MVLCTEIYGSILFSGKVENEGIKSDWFGKRLPTFFATTFKQRFEERCFILIILTFSKFLVVEKTIKVEVMKS